MSEPQQYWMADVEGAKALVVGDEARDFWSVRGWSVSEPPAGDEFVWLQHEQTEGRAKFPTPSVPHWAARGWHPSDPPVPVNLATAHQQPAEQPPAPPVARQNTAPAPKSAVSGDKKE
jgi:hypothetical protein